LNYFGTRFWVQRVLRDGVKTNEKGVVIWDVFKFFQCSFVKALELWQVAPDELVNYIESMKAKRSNFSNETPDEVRKYCLLECKYLAQLVDKLTGAHRKAGLNLTSYFGAGSTASAVLDTMRIKPLKEKEISYAKKTDKYSGYSMREAVMTAFFGGRFENSVIGPIREDVYSYDISSAYPYQITHLPCLVHGVWKYTTDREELKGKRAALVHWEGLDSNHDDYCWGPLPFRTKEGAIIFPTHGGQGFTYLDEFLAAERWWGIHFKSAWVLLQKCECQPFKKVPHYYNERCKLGKDGAGIVIKLGVNACYGKLAQSVGKPKYASWVWAGMVTSGCRAQLLEAIALHKNRSNVLMLATDGLYSRERVTLPMPLDTGTAETGKPLGGWEEKIIEGGMFAARPGINFPLSDSTNLKMVRGRGFGRTVIVDNLERILNSWHQYRDKRITLPSVARFCGAKSHVHRSMREFHDMENEGFLFSYTRSNLYGEWVEKDMFMSLDPRPKRRFLRHDNTLAPHKLPQNVMSAPYDKLTAEETTLSEYERIADEQPY
jgi:hypothetical protein